MALGRDDVVILKPTVSHLTARTARACRRPVEAVTT